jgi:hypothetical protein
MYFNPKQIVFYCQDIVRIHTANRKEDEDYWTKLDHKKFKAHLAISRILWEDYNQRESDTKDWEEIKNIHDNIQFITTDLRKSIGFEFKKNYTLKEIEDYSEKLSEVITEYVKSRQWVDLIKPRFYFSPDQLNKIKWILPDPNET